MKRILFFIMFFTVAISTRAQVTLDECRHAAQENYPLVRQYNLIQLAEQYNLSNASKGNLPQINISGKASYQSDATTFPIDIPGIGIKGLPKDQYQALIEVQQNIWDGGQIHHQKKEIKAVSQENKYQLDVSMYALNEQVNQVFFGILLLNEQLHQNALLHDNLQRNLKNIEAYRNNGIANDADVDAMKQDIVDRTNALRKENGIAALTTSDKLMQAAQVRADEMAANTVYSHTRPDGRNFNTVTDCPYMAENIHRIATRYLSQHDVSLAEAAVDGWANSETHLRNIRNERLNAIGVGIAKGINAAGEESWYCVQLFLYDGCVISQVDIPIMNK